MTGGSGLPSGTSYVTWDRDSCSWRTSPDLFGSGYLTSSPTLPTSGSMRSGVCSPRPPLAPRIAESDSGSWPTPRATDVFTPDPVDPLTGRRKRGTGIDLGGAARAWPIPQARDMKGRTGANRHTPNLPDAVGPPSETTPPDGATGSTPVDLNPDFVAALMGVPRGWLTPCTSVETDSFQRWLLMHSLASPNVSGLTCGAEVKS